MHALKVLEFQAVRERLRFHCETPFAAVMAEELNPSFEPSAVREALALTKEAHDALAKHSPPALGALGDPRESLTLAQKGAVLGGAELFRVAEGMRVMRTLRAFLEFRKADLPMLSGFAESLPDHRRLEEQLLDAIEPDGSIKSNASPALAALRSRKATTVQRIQDKIQSYISGRARDLLSDPIFTIRDGRYVLPLRAENRGKIRGIVHDTSGSGQTIYVEPEEVLQMGNALREIEASERDEIQRLLIAWSGKVGAVADDLRGGVEAASHIDFALAKARLGYEMKGTMPELGRKPFSIEIASGRHPLLDPAAVIPLDIEVSKGQSVLITGPNTGGKTVAIKCVGLFVAMAQSGLMPPAVHVSFSPFTQIWVDIGDEQSLQQSLSTFSGHIKNISDALRGLREGALVLLDEVGAGTDPAEGASLAKAILRSLAKGGAAILASTHYGELKSFAYDEEGFTNASMEFDTKTLRPTYKLRMGAPGSSQALRIAERYGIPAAIVEQARESLSEETQNIAAISEKLETAQKQARAAQGEADRRLAELRKAEERAQRKLVEADEIRRTAHAKANEVLEAALREIRLEASRLFDELKASPTNTATREKVRSGLRDLDAVGRDMAAEFLPKRQAALAQNLVKGVAVRVEGLTQPGTVLDAPKDGQVSVQMGMVKMSVPLERLELLERRPLQQRPKSNINLQKALSASTELNLRHMRAEDAMRELERFLDDAILAGLDSVRIVHGKGEGILRKATQKFLRSNPAVSGYRDGEPAEGGHGVTVASLA